MLNNLVPSKKLQVLLTGATGFVGAHFLQELIKSPDIETVYAICRDKKTNKSINVIDASLNRFELIKNHDIDKKLRLVKGDISLPSLGIGLNDYKEICGEADVIFHVAAQVNHVLPYQGLKAANVNSTAYLLKIALTGKNKIVNFISTLGSATRVNNDGKFVEDFPENDILDTDMGYLISKWASEKLVAKFHSSGYKANILRLGYVTGHSQTGVSLCYDNQLMLLIKSCMQLGFAPRLSRLINMTPVDKVATIINFPEFRHEYGRVVNIVNTAEYISWNELIEWFAEQNYNIRLIEFEKWQNKIRNIDENNALFILRPLFAHVKAKEKVMRFATNILQYDTDESLHLIKKYGVEMPEIKLNILKKYYDYLVRVGFFSINQKLQ